MGEKSILRIVTTPCPKCGGRQFKYNPPEIRKSYRREMIVGKYECLCCGEQCN